MSQVVKIVGSDGEQLELEELERLSGSCPTPGDVRIRFTLAVDNFRGKYDGIWLARPDVESFVRELKELSRRIGITARLESMSPGDFSLELTSVKQIERLNLDAPCSFFIDAKVGRSRTVGSSGKSNQLALTAGLEISEEQFNGLCSAL